MVRCAVVADHLVRSLDTQTQDRWVKEMRDDGMYPAGADERAALTKFFTRGCEEYEWTDDVRRCIVAQPTWAAIESTCEKQSWWYAAER